MRIIPEGIGAFENPLPHLQPTQRLLLRAILALCGGMIRVENGEGLMATPDPAIFALNHNNYLESLLVPATLIYLRQGRNIHFVIDWMFGRLPGLGYLFRQIDPIYVYTKSSSIPFLNLLRQGAPRNTVVVQCVDCITKNQSIGIFPEGTRNPRRDHLLKAHPGVGEIALRTSAPVIPVGICFPNLNKRDRIPELGRMVLRIGAPMTFTDEIKTFEQFEQMEGNSANERRKIRSYLSDCIARQIMIEIGRLSEKSYPYPSLPFPADMSKYISDELINS